MKKIFLLVIVALLTGMMSFAQENDQKINPYQGFDPYWYLNLNVGRNLMYGDFKSTPVSFNAIGKQTGFLGGGMVGYQFSPIWGLRGQVNGGTMKSRVDENPLYHFKSKTHFAGVYLEPTVDFTNMINYNSDRKFFLYGYAGLGMVKMYSELFNYTTATESIISKNGSRDFKDWTSVAVLPYGLGAKYKFDENWGINLEGGSIFGFNKADGDKLDGKVQGEHRDWIGNFTLGLNYDFTKGTDLKKMAENFCDRIRFVVTPNPLEIHGDVIEVTITGTVPANYMLKKAAIQITPELKYNGGSFLLNTITLKGEEVAGNGIAIPFKTGGTFTVKQTILYQPGMSASDLMVNSIIYKPATGSVDALATSQQIRSDNKFIDAVPCKIADGVIITPMWIKHDEFLLTATDKLVKENIVSKEAAIFFIFRVNKDVIDLKMPLNQRSKANLDDLFAFINQGWRIKNIEVNGYASPEGRAVVNEKLALNRAKAGREYIMDRFQKLGANKNATDFQKGLRGVEINSISHGGDWDGFIREVQASNLKDKNLILNICNTEPNSDKREQAIRKLKSTYKILVKEILPQLRRVNVKVNSYAPVLTDEQYFRAATTAPEKLKVEELLYSANLTKDKKVQLSIYQSTMKKYDGDWRAFNNAGVIELENGNLSQATSDFNTANNLSPNNSIVLNNLGAVEAEKGNVKVSLELFQKAQSLGANENYNANISLITRGNYPEAVTALSVTKCNHNLGLAQLLAGKTQDAIATLKCAPAASDTYYLLAVAGARTTDTSLLYDNLMKSVKMDASFKIKAAGDREFIRYFNTSEFQAIVK
jgi:tetratricopeptide (TPR) repeat protein